MKTFVAFRPSLPARFVYAIVVALGAITLATPAFCGPIHDAARKGDVKKVKELLASDPKLVNDKDKDGDTPLHQAALHGQLAVAQALIDAGANVNAKNNYPPLSPTIWARSSQPTTIRTPLSSSTPKPRTQPMNSMPRE